MKLFFLFLILVSPAFADEPLRLNSGYSYACWLNGHRKTAADTTPAIFAIDASRYGFSVNLTDFRQAGFAPQDHAAATYAEALATGTATLRNLPAAELIIELEEGGNVYRAASCKAGKEKNIGSARLWESGRHVQHYDFLDLDFRDAKGNPLACKGVLDLVAWPDSLTLTTTIAPDYVYQDGPGRGVVGQGLCVIGKPQDIPHGDAIDPESLTVEFWVLVPEQFSSSWGWLLCKNGNETVKGNFGFRFGNGNVEVLMNIAGGAKNEQVIRQQPRAFKGGEWNHLALTYDGKTMTFHINGKPQGTKEINVKRVPGTGLLRIGGRSDGCGKPVAGLYDNVRIWNRALTSKEIAEHAAHPAVLASREGLSFETTFDRADAAPFVPPAWNNARLRLQLKGAAVDCRAEKTVEGPWRANEAKSLSLTCQTAKTALPDNPVTIQVASGADQVFPVTFEAGKQCFVASVAKLKRTFKTGYTDIRDYDEFSIVIDNPGATGKAVPFLLDLRDTANVTGLCPILCDKDGRPTGIPVQLSKNWHYQAMGCYLMAYAALPAKPGKTEYRLRIAYGFYGALPSASHAQLSLVGYGGNGRWDQLAIGCWGETICYDMDMSCVDHTITDVRMLMARNGLTGQQWSWTEAGWGGDWLGITGADGEKLPFGEMKTAYLSQGPCLTDVRHAGFYGVGREVAFSAQVQTLRTDDYARNFQNLKYRFNAPAKADGLWLYKMGKTFAYVTPRIAYGNRDGLISEQAVPADLKPKALFVDRLTLAGDGPWWVAFPGATVPDGRNWGTGYRALVIRSYQATLGGKTYSRPTISLPVHNVQKDGSGLDLDLLLVAPREVDAFQPGDKVEFEVEWITLPKIADDYYGPNEAFRKHLAENPSSWKTTSREAIGNDLRVTARGGKVLNRYPIVIHADQPAVEVDVKGGVGFVPLRVEGLKSATGYALFQIVAGKEVKLDQAVHGNDFWQVDYDEGTQTCSLTYNLPLDNQPESRWILRKEENAKP